MRETRIETMGTSKVAYLWDGYNGLTEAAREVYRVIETGDDTDAYGYAFDKLLEQLAIADAILREWDEARATASTGFSD